MEQVQSVRELTLDIKHRLESGFTDVVVRGEISNYRLPASGHIYMTLKDSDAQLPAVVWKNIRQRERLNLKDGMEIVARGRIEVYPPAGRYQLICTSISVGGEGELQQAYAMLLDKLSRQGLFNPERKKPLPSIPETIGIATSATGAVIQDIRDVLKRRFAAARLMLHPVNVQGRQAVDDIVRALDTFNNAMEPGKKPDVIIIARGGGSLEDLQPFNEEKVALAIAGSTIPVISAVGHETDTTIADLVADRRAGTPSIAAEIAVPDTSELLARINTLERQLATSVKTQIEGTIRQIDSLTGSYGFNRPQVLIARMEEQVTVLERDMKRNVMHKLHLAAQSFSAAREKLDLLDYHRTLRRGFALVKGKESYLTSKKLLRNEENAVLLFHDGEIGIRVTDTGHVNKDGNDTAS